MPDRTPTTDPPRSDPRISALAGSGGAKYKAMSPARLPISRVPCLTIPPGLSPTSFLDSPVLLTNVKAEPSPTTGTFAMISNLHCSVGSDTISSPKESSNGSTYEEGSSTDFEFKPYTKSCLGSGSPRGTMYQQFVQAHAHSQPQLFASTCFTQAENVGVMSHELTLSVSAPNQVCGIATSGAVLPAGIASSKSQQEKGPDDGCQTIRGDQKERNSSLDKPSEDGYHWRKYGQKHVKGSEFPRSYYKCTHPNCQVKKQLECSHDGQITEIIYKGSHDHPKPQPARRSSAGSAISSQQEERVDNFSSLVSTEDAKSKGDGQGCHEVDPNGIPELCPLSESGEDVDASGVQFNNVGDVTDDEDPESKRRRTDAAVVDVNEMGKINREPRVVVQTLSEVDILDDGYRWRKYGQKVVKGNPNPRSYYKCTNIGCPVRKHVERAAHDPKAVITTYEGKHNHDVPAARTSSHDTTTSMSTTDSVPRCAPIPASYSSLPMTYESTVSIPHQYNRLEVSESVSLDLGLSPRPKKGSDDTKQTSRADHIQQPQNHMANNGYSPFLLQAPPVPAFYGSSSTGMVQFGESEEKGEGFSFKPSPLNHPSNPYQVNIGSLLMGP